MFRLPAERHYHHIRDDARLLTARAALLFGMFLPGILLATDPNHWTTTQTLYQSLHFSPLLTAILGGLLVIASIIGLFDKWRDVCYLAGLVFYVLIALANLIALIKGENVGALVGTLPVLLWLYAEATLQASQRHENKISEIADEAAERAAEGRYDQKG